MARNLSLLVVVLACGALAAPMAPMAQPSAAPVPDIDAQPVRVASGTATIDAYVARPKGAEKRAAVLIVHDDMGLTDPVRGVVRLFAQAGFVAMAPNLLSRSTASGSPGRPQGGGGEGFGRRTPVMGLPLDQTIDDVKAGFAFLQQDPGVDTARISAVGMGWGGYRVWKLAEQTPLYRTVVFYGITPTDDQVAKVTGPVLAHYAQYDFLLTASALKTQKQLGKRFVYHVYPADRGFLGGSSGSAIDITALAGEQDLFAPTSPTKAPTPASGGAPAAGSVAAARLSLERTFAFLRN